MPNQVSIASAAAADRPSAAVPVPFRPVGKILLLDGYSTRSLACARSWGKHGVPFVVAGESRWDMTRFSRYARERAVYTSPKESIDQFIRDLNALSVHFETDHIFPTSEAGILACSMREQDLRAVPIIPRREQIETCFSKFNTLRVAESIGIPAPETTRLSVHADAIPNNLHFPVVVKSETSEAIHSGKAQTSGKTYYATNREELRRECNARLQQGQAVLLQQFVDGYGVGISGLFDQGRPVVLIGHRRLRESNPLGGPSALAETIPIDPELLEATTALISSIGLTGPAMVEYKIDRHNGRPYLMEINGRFWGSILLALAAGLELPYLYWKMLNGTPIAEEEKRYRTAVIGRNIVGDTRWLIECFKGKPQGWPGAMPTRGLALREYCRSFFDQRTHELTLTREDPAPFLARLVQPHS